MNYEAWRITFQSSEQAARAAFAEWQKKPAECEPVAKVILSGIYQDTFGNFHSEVISSDRLSVGNKLFTTPQPCPDCLKWATDMSQVTQTLRYIIGIAERGTATTLPDGVTVESFVLDYVKGLEAKVEHMRKELKEIDAAINDPRVNLTVTVSEAIVELTKERDKERLVGDKLSAKLTRAESVIEKCAYGLEFEKDSITFLMEWCVKNINRWSFPAFDNLHAAISRRQETLAAITEYRGEGK